MLDNLESQYNCANASEDLHQLVQELAELRGRSNESPEMEEKINRIENQIHFIRNKCHIH